MNTLVLIPRRQNLGWSLFADDLRAAEGGPVQLLDIAEALKSVRNEIESPCAAAGGALDLVVVSVPVGGLFGKPTLATDAVLRQVDELAGQAPLHLPPTLETARLCRDVFAGAVVVLAFETAFFARLDERESSYGVDFGAMSACGFRRYGHHGFFHAAACRHVAAKRRESDLNLLSICLEPKPEIAAVSAGAPVMVTSGATPLEGLPGQTSCGELDPSIVLTLSMELEIGPEQVNTILSEESGLLGLAGRPVTLAEALEPPPDDNDLSRAGEILRYRILQACGAGVAAMGGLDALVFSGRYAASGESLGPWLAERLPGDGALECLCFTTSHDQLLCEAGAAALRSGDAVPADL